MESNRITTHIDNLLLDPNNYRFIDKSEYKFVPDDKLADQKVQLRTLQLLQGKNHENINDLIKSFTTNDYLEIDQIQVKPIGQKYLVLEGNRRICTLKYLYEQSKLGYDIGVLKENVFENVPVLEILDENPVQHLITMGLQHISGKKRWNAVNQAQLVYDLIYLHGKTEEEVCNSLGITKVALRRSTRTLSLIKQYKESDYGDQFESNNYSLFEEIIKSGNIRKWIGWNDSIYTAENEQNLDRIFSWLSDTEYIERGSDEEERTVRQEPIITKYTEIRALSDFILDAKAIDIMEKSRDISKGFALSDSIGETRLKTALQAVKTEVEKATSFSNYLANEDFEEINLIKNNLDKLLPTNLGLISINDKGSPVYFEQISRHFETIEIISYKKLNSITIKNLSRINIFAGGNNMGKTSILEGIYLLSQLNDTNAFLDLEKLRGKFYQDLSANWIDGNFLNPIEIAGLFNGNLSSVNISKKSTEDDIEKSNYLSTIEINATVSTIELESVLHLYKNKKAELRYTKSQVLCKASFTSPYRYNGDLLRRAHLYAVQGKYFEEIIEFIRLRLDNSITKIELVNMDGENRFMVTSTKMDAVTDITKYGEGLQRVFEIALLMVYSSDGILCIDEIDSALHKSLLIDFTKFIQQLAEKFNVQVFLSTHSKECIDAFVENDYHNDQITAYALNESAGKVTCKYINGNRLEQLVESINFDIR